MKDRKKTAAAKPLGAVISRDLPRVYQLAFKLAAIERDWAAAVRDPVLSERSRTASVDGSALRVLCDSPGVAQKISMSAGTILMRIERRFSLRLGGLRVQVAPVRKRRPLPKPKPLQLKLDEKTLQDAYERAMKQTGNERLALSLARLEAASKARFGVQGKPKPSRKGS